MMLTKFLAGAALLSAMGSAGCVFHLSDSSYDGCTDRGTESVERALSWSPVASPPPAVGHEASVFLAVNETRTSSCSASESHVPFDFADVSCGNASCVVTSVGAELDGRREIRFIPKRATFTLFATVTTGDSDEVAGTYQGSAHP